MPTTDTSLLRGHPIFLENGEFLYVNTGEPTIGSERACGRCQRARDENGHDGCLGTLPGVMNACCGHGDEDAAYVQLDKDHAVSGSEALRLIDQLKRGDHVVDEG